MEVKVFKVFNVILTVFSFFLNIAEENYHYILMVQAVFLL